MSKKIESKSNTPMLIIVGVLVAAVMGGWWFYSSSKTSPTSKANNAANAANKAKVSTMPSGAPPGAQPPNQAGSPSAVVRIEEFADFQCGSCAQVNPIMNEIKSAYGSKVHFIFRNFPLPMHPKGYEAAVAAEAAGLQNRFWDMQNQLFSNQQTWANSPQHKEIWKSYAEKIGLDVNKWENDMLGIAAKNRVDQDMNRGKGAGVNYTPTVYINDTLIPYTELNDAQKLRAIIDAELAKASQQQSNPAGAAQPQAASNTAK